MLSGILDNLNKKKIILGSTSESRKNMLSKYLGLTFDIKPSNFPETLDKSSFKTPELYCEATVQGKVDDLMTQNLDFDVLIAGDTIVVDNKENILEKPVDHNEQIKMLKSLSNTWHYVISALIVIIRKDGQEIVEKHLGKAKLYFSEIPEQAIYKYGQIVPDVYKHSGGYEISSYGFNMIEKIDGDWGTAIGLPINALAKILHKHFYEQQ